MSAIEIIRPGLLTTIQDLGRKGYRHLGVPVSGAMDQWSLRAANRLVGNPPCAAGLEMTLSGPAILFKQDCLASLAGAEMGPLLTQKPVPMWSAFWCQAGDILSFGCCSKGFRTYLAVAGGIDVPMVLNSRSTCLPAGFGGLHGRALKKGDLINNLPVDMPLSDFGNYYPSFCVPVYERDIELRVVRGIDGDSFGTKGYAKLFAGPYTVLPASNRMAYCLTGPPLHSALSGADGSAPVVPGTIQVNSAGDPVILMQDAQATGGYPQIACVIRADLARLAQAAPGDRVFFREIDYTLAGQIHNEFLSGLNNIKSEGKAEFMTKSAGHTYKITVQMTDDNGKYI